MFELNGDARIIAFRDIKGRSAIIVDDFYRNPDEIRELALSLEYSVDPGLVGIRSFLKRGSVETSEVKEKLYNIYLDLCRSIGPLREDDFKKNWDRQGFLVNQTNESLIKKNPMAEIPHQDYWEGDPNDQQLGVFGDVKPQHLQFGSVVYLNTPDECAGGTNLYSYKGEMSISLDRDAEWMQNMSETMDMSGPVLVSMSDDYKFKYIKDRVNKQYTIEFEAKMKYNRMFLYQSDVLHKGDMDLGMFTDYNRINQIFFM
jgi:hypothetical protein